jgi:RNA recognition motif-containing protein
VAGVCFSSFYLVLPLLDEWLRRRKFFQKYGKIKWARDCISLWKKDGIKGVKQIVEENINCFGFSLEEFEKYLSAVAALIPARMKPEYDELKKVVMLEAVSFSQKNRRKK